MATYSDGIIQYAKGQAQNASGATSTYTIQTNDFVEYTLVIVDGTGSSTSIIDLDTDAKLLSEMKIQTGKCNTGVIGVEQVSTGSQPWIIRLGDFNITFPSTDPNFGVSLTWQVFRNVSGA